MKRAILTLAILAIFAITAFGTSTCYQTTIAVDPSSVTVGASVATAATFTNCGESSGMKRVLIQVTATCSCLSQPLVDIFLGETTIQAGRTVAVSASFTPSCAGAWIVSADAYTRSGLPLAHSETALTVN